MCIRSRTYRTRIATWLAEQQGFAGHLTFDGRHFEWTRTIDFQPKAPLADAGSLRWQSGVLIEEGRDLPYVEHWHRDPPSPLNPRPRHFCAGGKVGTLGLLIRAGGFYILARDRAVELAPHASLAECIAAAPTLEDARALIDCEISFARASNETLRISASTLPHRVGCHLGDALDSKLARFSSEGDTRCPAPPSGRLQMKWHAKHPDRMQLYSLPTPNGVKVSIMLEEKNTGLPYEPHLVSFDTNDQDRRNFLCSIPTTRYRPSSIPTDRANPGPVRIRRNPDLSGGKNRAAHAADAARRYQALQWLMFQMAASARCSAR